MKSNPNHKQTASVPGRWDRRAWHQASRNGIATCADVTGFPTPRALRRGATGRAEADRKGRCVDPVQRLSFCAQLHITCIGGRLFRREYHPSCLDPSQCCNPGSDSARMQSRNSRMFGSHWPGPAGRKRRLTEDQAGFAAGQEGVVPNLFRAGTACLFTVKSR